MYDFNDFSVPSKLFAIYGCEPYSLLSKKAVIKVFRVVVKASVGAGAFFAKKKCKIAENYITIKGLSG